MNKNIYYSIYYESEFIIHNLLFYNDKNLLIFYNFNNSFYLGKNLFNK
jgi:hypothetical protein